VSRLVARPPAGGEIADFDALARREGELFQQPEWVDALGAEAQRVGIFGADGRLVGGFVARTERRFGITTLRNAPFSPSVGPFFERRAQSPVRRAEEAREMLTALATYLEPGRGVTHIGLSPSVSDVLPFRWRDFRTVVEYTYRLDLGGLGTDLLATFDGRVRNDVRKARRDGLQTEVGRHFPVVGDLEASALRAAGARGESSLASVLRFAQGWDRAYTVCVRRNGDLLGGSLVIGHGPIAYYIMGGHARGADGKGHHGAGSLSLCEAIAHARTLGFQIFDFEGSTIPGVESFFRGFGGTLTPYYSVSKAWLPLEFPMKLRWRRYF